jgi:hypothetical protein
MVGLYKIIYWFRSQAEAETDEGAAHVERVDQEGRRAASQRGALFLFISFYFLFDDSTFIESNILHSFRKIRR